MLRGDWAAAKEEVSKKNKRENDKTYQKKNPPVSMLGVGVMNRWRETYLTPTWYPDRYQAPVPIPTCALAGNGVNALSAGNTLGCSRGHQQKKTCLQLPYNALLCLTCSVRHNKAL